jgi:hypothetical protein
MHNISMVGAWKKADRGQLLRMIGKIWGDGGGGVGFGKTSSYLQYYGQWGGGEWAGGGNWGQD